MTPWALIDAARSARLESSRRARGCSWFGRRRSTSSSVIRSVVPGIGDQRAQALAEGASFRVGHSVCPVLGRWVAIAVAFDGRGGMHRAAIILRGDPSAGFRLYALAAPVAVCARPIISLARLTYTVAPRDFTS